MAGSNGDSNGSNDLTERDVRLAAAIGAAVAGALIPEIGNVTRAVETLRAEVIPRLDTLTTKVDQVQAGAVGIGRMAALEDRVAALESKRKS